jgi:hypothetical protein
MVEIHLRRQIKKEALGILKWNLPLLPLLVPLDIMMMAPL